MVSAMRPPPFSTRVVIALLLVAAGLRAEPPPPNFAKWEKEIAAFESADRENPPPQHATVFVGSSSIRLWSTLEQDFPEHRVINRGFGGSELGDSAHFADRIVLPYHPRCVVVYAGGNDINNGRTPEEVFQRFQDLVTKVRAGLPEADIAFISIAGNPARWAQVEKVKKANALIEAFIKDQAHLKFINVFPAMLGDDGLPLPGIFRADRLHMNAEGYQIWTRLVRPFLPPPDRK
ncbi:MAG: hypothetical protein QOE70_4406 [Chthoniobacter sp.]|jgi:lysophospholipase L1-like esterase|nr:hypothetical protein [Chthoniobacter sp.]